MDRILVYPGAIPLDSDVLTAQRSAMIALGYLAQATLGTSTVADGLACTQQTVANMTVNIAPGSIIALTTVDGTAYGSLAADTTDPLVKMGINQSVVVSSSFGTITAPGTSGQSINYLIQAAFQESDANSVVLPYYNSSNPAVPYSGPSNSGTPQNTQRIQRVNLGLKAGSPATTGSQVTPTPDSGFVGLWVITVAYAQTSITSGNIAQYPGAPFIGIKLPQVYTSIFSTFHVVTGARVAGTIYTNSTGKPMFVVVNFSSVGNAGVSLLVNGNTTSQVIFPVGGGNSTLYGVVPAGGTYQLVNVIYAITITGWGETW